jgi:hypothetical protein
LRLKQGSCFNKRFICANEVELEEKVVEGVHLQDKLGDATN